MSRWLYNYRSARMPGRTPLRGAHVWQFKCWLSALIRKPPDKRAKITVIWHVWYAYMYIPHIFPCRDWANLCDGRKQAWPDCVPQKKTCEKCRGLTFVRRFPAERGSFAGHTSLHRYIKYSLLVEIFDCTCYRMTARNVPLIWHMQPCRLCLSSSNSQQFCCLIIYNKHILLHF